MRKILFGMLAIMMLIMSGCGDATIAVVVPVEPLITPPSITSFQFTKDTAAAFIDGSVDFYAPDSDIDTLSIAVFDSGGLKVKTLTVINLPGVVRGSIPFSIDYITFPAGTYTFSVYLTDFNGLPSNQVVGTFGVP